MNDHLKELVDDKGNKQFENQTVKSNNNIEN